MGRAIVMTSGKGGTGKTTSAGAIGSCLASLGYKTLCLDGDVGLKNLDLSLGLTDIALLDFTDVLFGRASLEDAVTRHPEIENLYFLTAPMGIPPEEIDALKMHRLITQIKEEYDYCVIDSPAGIGAGFQLASKSADMAIVVATGDASSLRDGQKVVTELRKLGIPEIRLLVNRVRPALFRKTCATIDDIIDAVGAKLIGFVKEDEAVILAANRERPLILYSDKGAVQQFSRVARRITGENIPLRKL